MFMVYEQLFMFNVSVKVQNILEILKKLLIKYKFNRKNIFFINHIQIRTHKPTSLQLNQHAILGLELLLSK